MMKEQRSKVSVWMIVKVSKRCTTKICMGRFSIARSCAAFMGWKPISTGCKRCLLIVGYVSLDERLASDGDLIEGGILSVLID